MTSPLAAVIFDFDGIVLDSESPEYESHRRIFERCGAVLTTEEWCSQIGIWTQGHHERWHARLCELSPQAPDWPSFAAEQTRLFHSLVPSAPMPGIIPLLDALRARGIATAIASSAPSRWVVPAAIGIGVADRFQAIVAGDQVARRKPAADVYVEALRRLRVDPRRSVAIEDSAPGLVSAQSRWGEDRRRAALVDVRSRSLGRRSPRGPRRRAHD